MGSARFKHRAIISFPFFFVVKLPKGQNLFGVALVSPKIFQYFYKTFICFLNNRRFHAQTH